MYLLKIKHLYRKIIIHIITLSIITLTPRLTYNYYNFNSFFYIDFEFYLSVIKSFIVESIITVLLVIISYIPVRLCELKIRSYILSVFIYIIVLVPAIVNSYHIYFYKVYPTPSIFYALINTNYNEIYNFILSHIETVHLIPPLSLLILIWLIFKIHSFLEKAYLVNILGFVLILASLILFNKINRIHVQFSLENVFQINSVSILKKYINDYNLLKDTSGNRNFKNVYRRHYKKSEKEIYVFIIGESASKHHMSLYGYKRNTNPLLQKLIDSENIFVFDSVKSAEVLTIPSLKQVLTFAESEGDSVFFTIGNLIELYNQANFETYWLSNQPRFGIHESIVSIIAKPAKYKYYNTIADEGSYDEQLLPVFETILKEQKNKKVIFIHLAGSHFKYSFKYPPYFNYFNDLPPMNDTLFKRTNRQNILINQYDNSILYNDSIVYSIFKLCSKFTSASTTGVIYLSDHGEEVFEERNIRGHHESNMSMYKEDIPFILWKNNLDENIYNVKRKYNTRYFIHTAQDFTDVYCEAYDSTKSLLSPHYLFENVKENYSKMNKKVFSKK